MCVIYAFLNGRSNVDEMWYRDRLDLWAEDRLILKERGPAPGGAQTGILIFPIGIFVYKWLPWVLKLLLLF